MRLTFSFAALLAISSALNLGAQEVTAQIQGTVTDVTGAAIPGAIVTATNTETQLSHTVTTEQNGSFRILNLPVGHYDASVTKPGFRTSTTRNILLVLNQQYALNVALEVGQLSESVQVEANPVQVETTTTQLGVVIDSQKIVDLPLNGRNWTQLQQLVPGVVASSDRFGSNFATNGSQSQQNTFTINGADASDIPLNTPLIIPSPDAIGEFNLISSTINPEYGRNSGGVLNATIKQGTNQFHGSAFEFYRDTFLNARDFFQISNPVFHQNQYGGTVGGPIWKDHTFFFLSYQGTRNREPDVNGAGQTTVFTADQRNGYFPAIASSTALSPIPLIGESGATYAAGTAYSTIFPTGHIPTADFNPISQKLLAYVPAANGAAGLYSFNPTTSQAIDQGIARLDHSFSEKDSLWVSLFFQNAPSTDTLPFTGSSLPGFGDVNKSTSKLFTATENHSFTPTMLNEFRVSMTRLNFAAVSPQNPTLPSTLGFAINPQDTAGAGIPFVGINGYFNLGFSTNGPQPRIDTTYQATDNLSKVVGSHTLKFGFDGKRYGVANPFYGNNNGAFTFGGQGTYSTGDPGADFLLGIPDSYSQGSGGYINARTYEFYLYAQDSWKINNNLTLNYGVGYQIDTPLANQHFGGLAKNCFDPGAQSSVFPTAPVGLLFPGDKGCSQSGYSSHGDHFGPRFGFAYSPDMGWLSGGGAKKFVIRGGFGIYFNRVEEELALQDLGAVPFSLNSSGIADVGGSPSFAAPFTDIATGQSIANKFPFVAPTKGSPVNFSQFYPLDLNATNPNFTDPYSMNYNLNIQRELPQSMILQIGYVGAQGRHLELTYEANPISPAGTQACAADSSCIANRVIQPIAYPSHSEYAPGNIFASIGTQATLGVSSYNALQVSLNRRFSHGLSMLLSYTWSHSIDDGSGFENSGFNSRSENPFDFGANRGDSAFDARQRFVASYDYEIPGLSRYWSNPVTKYVVDGWRFSGITTFQSGFPITLADSGFRSLQCDAYDYYGCWDTPNQTGPVQTYNVRNANVANTTSNSSNTATEPYYYFNPNSFALEPLGTLGMAGRNFFHGPGIANFDLSLTKEVRFGEDGKRRVELRLDGFNAFNHTQFVLGPPSFQNIASANFGRDLTARPGRVVQLGAKIYF